MENRRSQSRERRAARRTEGTVITGNTKKTKRAGRISQYSPFQKTVIALSVLLVLATFTTASVYIINRNKDKKPDKNKTEIVTTDPKSTQTEPTDDENWDGISLRKTADSGQEYVDETLFIGDSNFRRLVTYGVVSGDNVIGMSGAGIQGALYSRGVYLNGYSDPVTPVTAVEIIEPRRVLLNFGTNNLGGYTENFISVYRDVIESIRDAYEYTDIIVMSVPALTRDISTEYGLLRMSDVDEFNAALKEMCRDLEVPFLNVTDECLKDPDSGYARSGIMYSDGIHIEGNGLKELIDYYRTHAYITEDRRPSGGTGISVREFYLPEPEPETVDCDEIISDVRSMLSSSGYTLVYDMDDWEGAQNQFTYQIDDSADEGEQDRIAKEAFNFICSACSTDSKIEVYLEGNIICINAYLPCVEHSFGDWMVAKIPTCSEEGREERKCEVCGFKEERAVAKDPDMHTYEWETVSYASCSAPGEERGVCSGCGHETTREIPKTEHDPEVTQYGEAATCTESGYTDTVVCSVCGEVLEESEEIPALGHDYELVDTETYEDGTTVLTFECSRCGDSYTQTFEPEESEDSEE